MKQVLVGLFFWGLAGFSLAEGLPPVVREALNLELEGRLGEALERYRAALSSELAFVEDDSLSTELTVMVYSKAAHLSIDLGFAEEAWDLGGRLLAAKNRRAVEAGTVVRMRIDRLRGRWVEALRLFDSYASAWPLPPPQAPLLTEAYLSHKGAGKSLSAIESLLVKTQGPAAWMVADAVALLPSPVDAWGLSVQETVRLQLGAFSDWSNALTLIDMLREKGWTPFTEVKKTTAGSLHVVYVVSRQPTADRARLEAQGIPVLP